jgi:2-polyprenyl-6-methoxyphenol hydroxylase-like FAD-dependent oxidoreductase
MDPTSVAPETDVVIVGYGPVGQTLAALLGGLGHRVTVLERRQGRYETPRAGHFDHEIMRVFQGLKIADKVRSVAEPALRYEFLDPDGALISQLPRKWDAPSRWDAAYHFYQPELEEVIDRAVGALPNVEVQFGRTVIAVANTHSGATATLEDGRTIAARYIIGTDGANSVVRRGNNFVTDDLGFQADWLVVDIRPNPGATLPDIPDTGQVLDPVRPNHMGRVGNRYFRWEFMLVDGDEPAKLVQPQRVWDLLERWIRPDQGELIRQTVYTFRSIVADNFRDGSILLAGDSAHVMPPFLGQGMSSGIRDAATLAWMLDLVIENVADPTLLDLYTASRRPNVLAYINESIRVGAVICETDPTRAAARRAAMRSATELPPPFQPPVGAGFVAGNALAGHLAVQPILRTGDMPATLADDVLGYGFALLSLVELDAQASEIANQLSGSLGLRSLAFGVGGEFETDHAFREWLTAAGVVAVVVRPDFYVYGSATRGSDIADLLNDLRATVGLTEPMRTRSLSGHPTFQVNAAPQPENH